MSKRIHELAKEWGSNPKDLIAMAERLGIRGKRSQSAVSDEEVMRLREGMGLTPRPAVTVGSERVVSERVVTQRDSSADQLVTAIEQTTETRLRPNVIRRRTAREVLKREELPHTPEETEPAAEDIPPSLDFEPAVPPALPELLPDTGLEAPELPAEVPVGETAPEPVVVRSEPTPAPVLRKPKTLMQLRHDSCRWPGEGHGADMLYCGAPAERGYPYCAEHCEKAYSPLARTPRVPR